MHIISSFHKTFKTSTNFPNVKRFLENVIITLSYKSHSGNLGSYFSNFSSKNFLKSVKKYSEECVERGGEIGTSSWWIQQIWKYFSNTGKTSRARIYYK